jgi:choline-sulfatase
VTEVRIRIQVYLAMIAEFDAMVGEYITAVADAGLTSRTIFVVTSDHGDMDMEQQQFYKMVPYEASTRVPLVIAGPNIVHATFLQATSLIDLYPTLLDFAKAKRFENHDIDGHSLVPLLDGSAGAVDAQRPQWALSQGHMADNAISWFVLREGDMKLIVYGTGEQNEPQLFNITRDPMETEDLALTRKDVVASMTATLKTAIDFPAVALDVAECVQ